MIEWLIPAAILGAGLIPKQKTSDRQMIDKIFENAGYGIKKKDSIDLPRLKKKWIIKDGEETIGTTYAYLVPLGLPMSKMKKIEKDMRLFSDGIGKPVIFDYKNRLLHVKVFNADLPEMFSYSDIPQIEDKWVVPLGKSVEGIIWHDFDHTPHMTVAGTTRFGKTVTLKVLTTYLIENHQDDAEFYIIDLKGGLEFNRHKNLRQVKQVASNPEEAIMLLFSIKQQIEKDYIIFKKKYWTNITNTPIKTRKFIIVDEAASLTAEKWMDKEMKAILGQCQAILSEISRIAGGMGYRLIFATQYPTADTMPRQIKQNSDAKITFRLPSGYASEVAIDDRGAEELPSNIKGRALFKTHELREMQAPYISDEDMWDRVGKYQEATILDMEPGNVVSK